MVGEWKSLEIVSASTHGLYLDGFDRGEILLPNQYVADGMEVGDVVEVFVYLDSGDRIVATTLAPLAVLGDFVRLNVVSVNKTGAFLDWGLPKDLLLPYAEQMGRVKEGQSLWVYVYLDTSGRLCASMKFDRHLQAADGVFEQGQEVDLCIASESDLGFMTIIDRFYLGLLYKNEVFQELALGDCVSGYIARVRSDRKVDVALQKAGYQPSDTLEQAILEKLHESNGFLEVHDKTSPDVIYSLFAVSKKRFKAAIGGLLRKKRIQLKGNGIVACDGQDQ